ncbi:hypothetical protein BU24DRAFT_249031 [Aaosphaeria arxii CBS 175.79]|uniref:FAD-binding domain-containing protein n=1 Tax=Aaosphaeria arxii CBS 175.79 TaxID=1450172 RepID=A0A6A5XLP5_9PLEO|nr:uncharacterized protein BU24DRAFT_249031 [Aaosphaeria arxii CBS 175.79]KAF2013873.1 hypothetical protein BU24DRAFT_249031 [Aaosphaeria arxii CBS 175.79]
MSSQPYQRCSQAIFEAWLKPHIQKQSKIDSRFGWEFIGLEENDSGVVSQFRDTAGEHHTVTSDYLIACDGAGSRVRKSIGAQLIGGPVPGVNLLVHFKSPDLARLHAQGQFWHIFFTSAAVIIAQDEVDTWTVHLMFPLGTDVDDIDPYEAVYKALGGHFAPYKIEITEILVKSKWRPNIYLADKYISEKGRIFLSGDSAHQNIPTGGYGMNTAVGDSFDIGWKLGAMVLGYGGPHLLSSYEQERRPVARRNIEMSGVHQSVHNKYLELVAIRNLHDSAKFQGQDWEDLKQDIANHLQTFDGENKDHGIEMGYRYNQSNIAIQEDGAVEPVWDPKAYIPSTWPGARAPHVYLADGKTSIHEYFGQGPQFTVVDFTEHGEAANLFRDQAAALKIPLKVVHLPHEDHVHKIWERDVVLVRPDDHVTWRSQKGSTLGEAEVKEVLLVAVGQKKSPSVKIEEYATTDQQLFTGTVGNVEHDKVEALAAFQK